MASEMRCMKYDDYNTIWEGDKVNWHAYKAPSLRLLTSKYQAWGEW